jgi:glycosyltransferase involved in cell wall biosynthesis
LADLENKVTIMMGTYNGAKFLLEQLLSLESQEHKNWELLVSDDGSTDDTLKLLQKFQDTWPQGKLTIVDGPHKGFCQNFLSLLDRAQDSDYFAWADQDDIWCPYKLTQSIEKLRHYGDTTPALYCSRTTIVDEHNNILGMSPLRSTPPPSFSNALVQSLAGANTMVFNQPARELIKLGLGLAPVSHDWWAYQVVTGVGGQLIYDPKPTLRYRQHTDNIIGSNKGIFALLSRIRKAWQGSYREMNNKNILALQKIYDKLTNENKKTLDAFISLRKGMGIFKTFDLVRKFQIHRRSKFQQFALYVGLVIGKV